MSEKRFDNYNRWRSKTVAFRMSPEEADELDVQVALSGLSKQDYLIQCCLIDIVPLEEFPELIHEDHYFTNEWRKILSNLNGKYQIVMELYYVDGFSTKEIARMLHITEVNVRSRMVRGRKQLEQILTVRAMD